MKDKGKKQVHYTEAVEELPGPGPVSPTEVLGRTPTTAEATTSAAASKQSSPGIPESDFVRTDVVLRGMLRSIFYYSNRLRLSASPKDRMLVRVYTTKAEYLNLHFDESMHRTTRDLEYQDWAEFVVAWRKDFVEIYQDYVR
jgi:hypothetical protein